MLFKKIKIFTSCVDDVSALDQTVLEIKEHRA
jgi:hypothetical protein